MHKFFLLIKLLVTSLISICVILGTLIAAAYILPTLGVPVPYLQIPFFNNFLSSIAILSPEEQFHPTSDIITLANQATMTDKAKRIFYATHPIIDTDKAIFTSHCNGAVAKNSVELGCYTSDNHIYILSITNPVLKDEMIVVAAHEMLHAARQQFSQSETETINHAIEDQLPQVRNKELSRLLRNYRTIEPGERDNELHSILGTEYPDVGTTLENHYDIYFSNRSTVVSFAKSFNATFSDLENMLTSLKNQIQTIRQQMKELLLQRKIKKYNILVEKLNLLIKEYNSNVKKYNQLSQSLRDNQQEFNTE